MSTRTEQDGRTAAENDWAGGKVVILNYGDVYSHQTVIDPTGFYLVVSWEAPAYIRGYNGRVSELLETEGVPDWAPGKRVVRRDELGGVRAKAEPMDRYVGDTKEERNLVRRTARFWRDKFGIEPSNFARLCEREVIVLFGRQGGVDRAEVLDTRDMVQLATYEWHDIESNEV